MRTASIAQLVSVLLFMLALGGCTPHGAPPYHFIYLKEGESHEQDHAAIVDMVLLAGFAEDPDAPVGHIVNPQSSSPWKVLKVFRFPGEPKVYLATELRYPAKSLEITIFENQRDRPYFPPAVQQAIDRLEASMVARFGPDRVWRRGVSEDRPRPST